MSTNKKIKQLQGCLAGGALAGAMGTGRITDDTQMALFTAEGLILSRVRADYNNGKKVPEAVFYSLLRWLYTQHASALTSLMKEYGSCSIVDGILMGNKELFNSNDPSGTCLKVLDSGKMGTFEYLPNQSKGPGAIARNIPVGMVFQNSEHAFQTGCECAVITHGHPSAYLCAGFLSSLISEIISNNDLEKALENSISTLKTYDEHDEVLETIYQAKNLSMRMRPSSLSMEEFFPDRSALHVLGAALFFTLAFGSSFNMGMQEATDRSITTESCEIAGAILGAIYGIDSISQLHLSNLELSSVILEISEDLFVQYLQAQT